MLRRYCVNDFIWYRFCFCFNTPRIIIIIIITFMQCIYSYIPETNRVSRVCSVAAVLCLKFALHVILFRPLNIIIIIIIR